MGNCDAQLGQDGWRDREGEGLGMSALRAGKGSVDCLRGVGTSECVRR